MVVIYQGCGAEEVCRAIPCFDLRFKNIHRNGGGMLQNIWMCGKSLVYLKYEQG
jgi:hypothetical protein